MKLLANMGRCAALAATFGMIVAPVGAFAEQPVVAASPLQTRAAAATPLTTVTAAFNVTDVALDAHGSLTGQALSQQGQPLANQSIVLDDGTKPVSLATNENGEFRFDAVRGGAYRVEVAGQSQFFRAWKDGTAPPSASRGLMVVEGGSTVLAQYCGSPVTCGSAVGGGGLLGAGMVGIRESLRNPLVVGGIVAAAIAIPVALSNSDDDDPAPAS